MLAGAKITEPRNGRGYLGIEPLSWAMLISPSASSRPGPAYRAVSDAGSADMNAASCWGHQAFTIACSVAKEWAAAGAGFPQADNKKAIPVIASSEGNRRGDFTAASMQETSVNSIGQSCPTRLENIMARNGLAAVAANRCPDRAIVGAA